MSESAPNLSALRVVHERLQPFLLRTPVIRCPAIEAAVGGDTEVYAKMEFMQRTGTFKARGALTTLLGLSSDEYAAGITAVSAGNHAIAAAYAAKAVGTTAKVVMIATANPSRIAACEAFGADVILERDVHKAFDVARGIQETEGRFFVHPFEGPAVALGAGTIGLEICEQIDEFDALVVPVGGGGLIGGVANAVKQLRPTCDIIGIEPEGADSMHRSFASGKPESIERVATIADSLGAPFALPYSFALTRKNVDRLALVNDKQLRLAMGFLFRAMKMAVEPACTAATAAILGPLRSDLRGKRVVLMMCGSNIDWATFQEQAIFDDAA